MCSSPGSSIVPRTPRKPRIRGKSGQVLAVQVFSQILLFSREDSRSRSRRRFEITYHNESHSSKCPYDQLPCAARSCNATANGRWCTEDSIHWTAPWDPAYLIRSRQQLSDHCRQRWAFGGSGRKRSAEGAEGSAHWLQVLKAGSNERNPVVSREDVVLRVAYKSLSNHTLGGKHFEDYVSKLLGMSTSVNPMCDMKGDF